MKAWMVGFTCVFTKAFAMYVGNPASCEFPKEGLFSSEEDRVAIKVAYQTEVVLDRKMENTVTHSRVENAGLRFEQGVVFVNFLDRLEIIASLGTLQIGLSKDIVPGAKLSLDTHANFSWSIGGQSELILWGNTSLGVVANYLASSMTPETLFLNHKPIAEDSTKLSYNTWQVALALSQKVDPFSVYIGGVYSYATLQMQSGVFQNFLGSGVQEETYRNRHALSMVLGVSLAAHKAYTLNVETQAFGQIAIGMNMCLRF
ncbi:MAG: hypothetical protein FJZ63_05945 [Chlamydiae bacterium]|nr:hypothetical protein [Chlamydiota bacterium]